MKNKVDIFYCLIEEKLLKTSYEVLLKKIPLKVRTRIQRFIRWEDAHACLIGYLLVERFVLKERESLNCLQTNRYGKPYLENGPFFNVTHSGRLIALAVAEIEIGIDVELIQEYDYLSLIEEFASEKEKTRILYSRNPLKEFLNCWTQKEACIKQIGKGLSIPLKSFEISDGGVAYIEADKLKVLNLKIPAIEDYILNLALPYDLVNNSIELAININSVSVYELSHIPY